MATISMLVGIPPSNIITLTGTSGLIGQAVLNSTKYVLINHSSIELNKDLVDIEVLGIKTLGSDLKNRTDWTYVMANDTQTVMKYNGTGILAVKFWINSPWTSIVDPSNWSVPSPGPGIPRWTGNSWKATASDIPPTRFNTFFLRRNSSINLGTISAVRITFANTTQIYIMELGDFNDPHHPGWSNTLFFNMTNLSPILFEGEPFRFEWFATYTFPSNHPLHFSTMAAMEITNIEIR